MFVELAEFAVRFVTSQFNTCRRRQLRLGVDADSTQAWHVHRWQAGNAPVMLREQAQTDKKIERERERSGGGTAR